MIDILENKQYITILIANGLSLNFQMEKKIELLPI